MLFTWMIRLNYLNAPDFYENEKYLENYKKLHGIINKPRLGFFVELYYYFSKKVIILAIIFIVSFGLMFIIFNEIEQFIKYNILLLIIALVISIIFAIVYWNKYWYSSISFLLKRKNK
jgi:hypothetical protein